MSISYKQGVIIIIVNHKELFMQFELPYRVWQGVWSNEEVKI